MGDRAGRGSEGDLDREALTDSSCLPRGLMSHCIAILKVILIISHDVSGGGAWGRGHQSAAVLGLLKWVFLGRALNPCKRLFKNRPDTWEFPLFLPPL